MIHSTPTTSSSTGEWFHVEGDILEYHTKGTPSNKGTTTRMTAAEARQYFAWRIENDPEFDPVKNWIEANT